MSNTNRPLSEYFDDLTDPRVDRTKLHSLPKVIFLTIVGVLSGAESWVEIEEVSQMRSDWLGKHIDLSTGIPSHDTFGNVFARLDPDEFEDCFLRWVNDLAQISEGEVIAIDGKTLRGSYDKTHSKAAVHMVSAWANANRLVIGQQRTSAKSNEITAIPGLLQLLSLHGAIVTIDAMGCQKEIAEQIISQEADYILALKTNQPALHEQVEHLFNIQPPDETDEQVDAGHGRVETRKCTLINDFKWLEEAEEWAGLRSIAKIERTRYDKSEGTTTTQVAYYISSLHAGAAKINQAVRAHWGIENSLHWCMDMVFSEDSNRTRNGHSAQNLSLVKKIAMNLLRSESSPNYKKASLRVKLKRCGWSHQYLEVVLGIN